MDAMVERVRAGRPRRSARARVVSIAPRPRGAEPVRDLLQSIPGIGVSLARDLRDLGFHEPADLRGADPEKMYADLMWLRGEHQDRCVLYVFRCAVYYADAAAPDPELLKWWNWKDRTR